MQGREPPAPVPVVFLKPPWPDAEPFTTSEAIAESAGVQHHAIRQLIQKYKGELEGFGVLAFEMRKPPEGSKGGRPELIYQLSEEQAAFLLTLLRNTPQVVTFKRELVRQFYEMREELRRRRTEREQLRPARKDLTNAIRHALPDSPHKDMCYRNYTNLAYMAATGKTAKTLRKERGGTTKTPVADLLTPPEAEAAQTALRRIAGAIRDGMEYQEIKRSVLPPTERRTSRARRGR